MQSCLLFLLLVLEWLVLLLEKCGNCEWKDGHNDHG
jgi:hypothetical protein